MNPEFQKILESKRALRARLAAKPIAEKLRLLDALRDRSLALRHAHPTPKPLVLREEPKPYRAKSE